VLRTLLSRLKTYWNRFTGAEKKLLLVLFIVIFASLLFTKTYGRRYTTEMAKAGGSYTEGLIGQPRYINPLLAPASSVDMDLSRIVFSGLLKFDKNLNIAPDLAETLPVLSANGREYMITLRENLVWPGREDRKITADDVVFTFHAIQNPDYQSPLRLSWGKVTVEKIDERKIKITTAQASATFIANLTVGIIPKHIWENIPGSSFALSKYNIEPIGSGAFQVSKLKRNRAGNIVSMSFKANKKYHLGAPYIENLNFKFYQSSEELIEAYHGRDIDGLGSEPFDRSLFIEPKKNLLQEKLELPQYQAVFINEVKNPAPLGDARVRLALAKSVDKKKIISTVYGDQSSTAYGPILPGHLGYHEQIPGAPMNIYDIDAAKKLLEESGWILDPSASGGFRKDKQNRVINLSLVTNDFTPNLRVSEALKQMWESIGIKISLTIVTRGELEEKYIRSRNYELLLFSENVGPDPDPYPFWHSSQRRDPGLNLTTFANAQADKLLAEARGNLSPSDRAARYKQFQEIFVGSVPAIFLSRGSYVYNITSEVKGLDLKTVVTPADRFNNVNEWYIETKRIKK